jgi:hypothetical protein
MASQAHILKYGAIMGLNQPSDRIGSTSAVPLAGLHNASPKCDVPVRLMRGMIGK